MRLSRSFRLLPLALLVAASVVALPGGALAATPWKVALPPAQPGVAFGAHEENLTDLPAVSCDPATPLRFYARAAVEYPNADDVTGYPDQPAGTVPAGQVVQVGTAGARFIDIRLYIDGPVYSAEIGRLCRARWVASRAVRAAATRAIPQLQVIGPITGATRTVLRRISQAPAKARVAFDTMQYLGVLQNVAPLPSIQGWEYLTGNCSRVGEATTRTCASLPGLGDSGFGDGGGFIAMPARDSYSSFGGVAFHEFGHAVDDATAKLRGSYKLSNEASWKRGPFAEAKHCWSQPYERNSSSEWFAESFAMRYVSTSKSLWLKRHCPVTWKYHTTTFGQGTFDSTIPTPRYLLPGELRTIRLVPRVTTGLHGAIAVQATLSARPAAGSLLTATATYHGKLVAKRTWRTSRATSAARLVARGVPAGAMVRVCVKAGSVGRGTAPIPSWCALARVR